MDEKKVYDFDDATEIIADMLDDTDIEAKKVERMIDNAESEPEETETDTYNSETYTEVLTDNSVENIEQSDEIEDVSAEETEEAVDIPTQTEEVAESAEIKNETTDYWANLAGNLGEKTARFFNKAKSAVVKVADQNNDGNLDLQDVSIVMDAIGATAQKAATVVKESAADTAMAMELKILQPIFLNDLDSSEFMMPKFIHITDMDKRHAESEVCKNSIGYYSTIKDMRLLNIYYDKLDQFGISLYPDSDYEFYYVDPCDRDHYIALDKYFRYLKLARINELQKVAKSLGAKHITVTYEEKQVEFSQRHANAHSNTNADIAKRRSTVESGADFDRSMEDFETIEVAAVMDCAGHDPVYPELNYLRMNQSIQMLIDARMDSESPITHHEFRLNFSDSSGMKELDAMKIDAVLKFLKCTGNATVTSEVKNEARRILEYEIDF